MNKTALEIIRERRLNMRHIYGIGLREQGKRITDGELQRLYDSMCSYIAQHAAPSKNQHETLRVGLIRYASDLVEEVDANASVVEEPVEVAMAEEE